MLIDTFLKQHADLKANNLKAVTIEELNEKLNAYHFVDNTKFIPAENVLYNERVISLDEFRMETVFAMLLKFSTEVTWPMLKIDLTQDDNLAKKLVDAGFGEQTDNIFTGYRAYSELTLANESDKSFTIINNADMTDEYYCHVFEDLSDTFFSILQQEGYEVFPTATYESQNDKNKQYVN